MERSDYGEEFSEIFDSYSLSEKDYYKQFDETVKKLGERVIPTMPKPVVLQQLLSRVILTVGTNNHCG